MKPQSISTETLIDFLGIPRGRFDAWMQHSLLGEKTEFQPGKGKSRRYTFLDVVGARLAQELLKFGGSFDRIRGLVTAYRKQMRKGEIGFMTKDQKFAKGPVEKHMALTLSGPEDDGGWLVTHDIADAVANMATSVLVIRLDTIHQEIREAFPQLTPPAGFKATKND